MNRHPDAGALVAKTERGKAVIYFVAPRLPNDKSGEARKHMIQRNDARRR